MNLSKSVGLWRVYPNFVSHFTVHNYYSLQYIFSQSSALWSIHVKIWKDRQTSRVSYLWLVCIIALRLLIEYIPTLNDYWFPLPHYFNTAHQASSPPHDIISFTHNRWRHVASRDGHASVSTRHRRVQHLLCPPRVRIL